MEYAMPRLTCHRVRVCCKTRSAPTWQAVCNPSTSVETCLVISDTLCTPDDEGQDQEVERGGHVEMGYARGRSLRNLSSPV